ncbi:MAG: Holliday junction branch migration protein RuvA [Sorangiineae bacterium PRO1]|nr:Holliday junction branch migration protein RuvA [Sorangiineae bacterium PRO1]
MIGRLSGVVAHDDASGELVIDVAGVGYEVTTPVGARGRAESNGPDHVVLFIHTHVREDSLNLFGFPSEQERRVFRLLIGVPNVGPKTALGVLSALPIEELSRAVEAEDLGRLSRVPGIGKKTAERLVLELREKLPKVGGAAPGPAPRAAAGDDDARKLAFALTNMGYRSAEADRAVRALGDRVGKHPLADLLREALAHLTP